MWDKLVAGLPAGVVTRSDEESINELVKVWEMMQKARKICEADLADDKAMSQYTKLFDRWYKLINEYGGTPNSRAKLQVPRSKEDREQTDAFGAILDRATGGRN